MKKAKLEIVSYHVTTNPQKRVSNQTNMAKPPINSEIKLLQIVDE